MAPKAAAEISIKMIPKKRCCDERLEVEVGFIKVYQVFQLQGPAKKNM